MKNNLPKRKAIRLKGYDYSAPGAYFITICIKDRKELLSKIIVGDDEGIVPTKNIENIIRSFKIMLTKEIGYSIWQRSFHDYIIRSEKDYQKIWEYIDTNVLRWEKDCFYNDERSQ